MSVGFDSLKDTNTGLSQRSLEKLVDHIFATTDERDVVRFYGWALSGKDWVEHHWNLRIAAVAHVTPQTAYNWTSRNAPNGGTSCTKGGVLATKARLCFSSDLEEIQAIGEFLDRDFLKEVGIHIADIGSGVVELKGDVS